MKWSVVVLMVLGVVAALCAALLVVSLPVRRAGARRRRRRPAEAREVTYVVAARDLAARTVVESDAVDVRRTRRPKDFPAGLVRAAGPGDRPGAPALAQEGSALRRVLLQLRGHRRRARRRAPGGQARGQHPALGFGRRRGAPLSRAAWSTCWRRCSSRTTKGLGDQPMSMTLLQGDLRPGRRQPDGRESADRGRLAGARRRGDPPSTVTLLVDTKQAEMLYLARQRGSVSIALRNPMDTVAVGTEGTRLPSLSPVFAHGREAGARAARGAPQRSRGRARAHAHEGRSTTWSARSTTSSAPARRPRSRRSSSTRRSSRPSARPRRPSSPSGRRA